MSEFQVGGHTYRVGRLDAMQQFDVARKWAPVLIFLAGGRKPESPEPTPDEFARAFCAVSAAVPQHDNDIALNLCLSAVTQQTAGGAAFAPVLAGNGKLVFQDMDMPEMLQIVGHVLRAHRLTSFFSDPPAASTEGAPRQT